MLRAPALFGGNFTRGSIPTIIGESTHMPLLTNQNRTLGHIKLLQGAPQQLDYTFHRQIKDGPAPAVENTSLRIAGVENTTTGTA